MLPSQETSASSWSCQSITIHPTGSPALVHHFPIPSLPPNESIKLTRPWGDVEISPAAGDPQLLVDIALAYEYGTRRDNAKNPNRGNQQNQTVSQNKTLKTQGMTMAPAAPEGVRATRLAAPGAPDDIRTMNLRAPAAPEDILTMKLTAPAAPEDIRTTKQTAPASPEGVRTTQEQMNTMPPRMERFLSRAMPFGVPVMTGNELWLVGDGNVLPPLALRATPFHLLGSSPKRAVVVPDRGGGMFGGFVNRITGVLISKPKIQLQICETVSAVLYKHEQEFYDEHERVEFVSVSSWLECISRLTTPSRVQVCLLDSNRGLSKTRFLIADDCVLEMTDEDDSLTNICFVPPLANGEDSNEIITPVELARWRFDTSVSSCLNATYRLRRHEETKVEEFQIVLKLTLPWRNRSGSTTQTTSFSTPAAKLVSALTPSKTKIEKCLARFCLPCKRSISSLKMQDVMDKSVGISFNGRVITWDAKIVFDALSSDDVVVLSGIATCDGALLIPEQDEMDIFDDETSCCVIDFEFTGDGGSACPHVSVGKTVTVDDVSITSFEEIPRRTKSTNARFVVWNPFGIMPKVPIDYCTQKIFET